MTLQQLRFLAAIVQGDLSMTAAATTLYTTQPGISKQIKALERELGFDIFARKGRMLTAITPAGQRVVVHALRALRQAESIRDISAEYKHASRGSLPSGRRTRRRGMSCRH